MNENAELLNFIYQNSQMGMDTISQIIEFIDDQNLKTQLQTQLNEYQQFHIEARKMLNQNGYDEKGIDAFEKIRTYLMINIQTLTDKTTPHIAEMLMIGSNMGVIHAVKNLKKYKNTDQSIKNLMDRLSKFEENNIQQLKGFL